MVFWQFSNHTVPGFLFPIFGFGNGEYVSSQSVNVSKHSRLREEENVNVSYFKISVSLCSPKGSRISSLPNHKKLERLLNNMNYFCFLTQVFLVPWRYTSCCRVLFQQTLSWLSSRFSIIFSTHGCEQNKCYINAITLSVNT